MVTTIIKQGILLAKYPFSFQKSRSPLLMVRDAGGVAPRSMCAPCARKIESPRFDNLPCECTRSFQKRHLPCLSAHGAHNCPTAVLHDRLIGPTIWDPARGKWPTNPQVGASASAASHLELGNHHQPHKYNTPSPALTPGTETSLPAVAGRPASRSRCWPGGGRCSGRTHHRQDTAEAQHRSEEVRAQEKQPQEPVACSVQPMAPVIIRCGAGPRGFAAGRYC